MSVSYLNQLILFKRFS